MELPRCLWPFLAFLQVLGEVLERCFSPDILKGFLHGIKYVHKSRVIPIAQKAHLHQCNQNKRPCCWVSMDYHKSHPPKYTTPFSLLGAWLHLFFQEKYLSDQFFWLTNFLCLVLAMKEKQDAAEEPPSRSDQPSTDTYSSAVSVWRVVRCINFW